MARRHPLPIDVMTLDRWIRAGILHLPLPGTGRHRRISESERRAIRAADSVRRLGGITPYAGQHPPAMRSLMVAAAQAARANPPGTVVELPSKSPHVRHVLIVPEPYPASTKGGS